MNTQVLFHLFIDFFVPTNAVVFLFFAASILVLVFLHGIIATHKYMSGPASVAEFLFHAAVFAVVLVCVFLESVLAMALSAQIVFFSALIRWELLLLSASLTVYFIRVLWAALCNLRDFTGTFNSSQVPDK